MSRFNPFTKDRFEGLKNLSISLREIIVVFLILIFITQPQVVPTWMCKAGFKAISAFDTSVQVDCSQHKVDSDLSTVNAANADQTLEEKINLPIPNGVVQTFSQAKRIAPSILPRKGWIFIGKSDGRKENWDKDQPVTIDSTSLPIEPGTVLTIKKSVYLRGDVPSNQNKSSGQIVSVAQAGEQFKVDATDFSEAKAGGYFVWADVHTYP